LSAVFDLDFTYSRLVRARLTNQNDQNLKDKINFRRATASKTRRVGPLAHILPNR